MALSASLQADGPDPPSFPDEALIAEMERIREPALLYVRGGRIAALNSAMALLSDLQEVGMSVWELLGRLRRIPCRR